MRRVAVATKKMNLIGKMEIPKLKKMQSKNT